MKEGMLRRWRLLLPLGVAVLAVAGAGAFKASTASGAKKRAIRVAIMTDCQGEFGGGYELDIGGAQAGLAQYAGARPKNKSKPSAGITGGSAGGAPIKIVGYGCGNDTAGKALSETRRLMQQLKADVMLGPLSGDEAVAIANWAKSHPTKTIIIGTAGSQDPTLQIHPKNVFRYHGDGAQWNAGAGEIAYKKLKWRKAAIIMDDYSFGWTSAAGFIADFCAVGGKITKRVFPPLNTTDYSSYVRQLPPPSQVDGYFWAVGGAATLPSLRAYEQAYGRVTPKKFIGNLFFTFLGADKTVAPRLVGAYVGGFGTAPGLKTAQARTYVRHLTRWYPQLAAKSAADGFVYNYYNAAWALVQGLKKAKGNLAKLQRSLPRTIRPGYQVSNRGRLHLDSRRQAIQDQYPLQIKAGGKAAVIGLVPNVDETFSGLFKPTSPPPGRNQPKCVKRKLKWQGKIHVVQNGRVTKRVIR
jgi:branched-chain amino acid transport system substrate-binding protein